MKAFLIKKKPLTKNLTRFYSFFAAFAGAKSNTYENKGRKNDNFMWSRRLPYEAVFFQHIQLGVVFPL